MRIILGLLVIVAALVVPKITHAIDTVQLYGAKCAACHGPKGEGTPVGPPQKGNAFIAKGSPAEIKKVIMEGRAGKDKKYPNLMADMPKGLVSEAEADALVKFLQGDLQK